MYNGVCDGFNVAFLLLCEEPGATPPGLNFYKEAPMNSEDAEILSIVHDLMQRDRLTMVYPHDRLIGSSVALEPDEFLAKSPCYECDAEWKPKEGDKRDYPQLRLTHEDTCPWQRLIDLTETDSG